MTSPWSNRWSVIAFAVVVDFTTMSRADVRVPAIFSDHMVLQCEKPAAVWGWAEPGEAVAVTLGEVEKSTTAGTDGRWSVALEPAASKSRSQTMTVRGRNLITVNDVLIGEVWLCSGQSNMAMQLNGLHGKVDRAEEEIAAADHPQMRMFVHDAPYSIYELATPPQKPLTDRSGKWVVCSPATAAQFSAIAYFFGRDIQRELRRPVGLVVSSVGGTPIEAWTSLSAQQMEPGIQPVLGDWQNRLKGYDSRRELKEFATAKQTWLKQRAAARKQGIAEPKAPSAFKNLDVMAPAGLFNGMIASLAPYAVRGVLWYQGERNAAGPLTHFYGLQLRTLVADWRAHWHDPTLYFAWVQLPGFGKQQRLPSEPSGWGVAVCEGQFAALDVPNTAMAVTIDLAAELGHPTNKVDYARRLAVLALHDVYGRTDVAARGPLFRSARRDGATMVLGFDHAEGLKPASGELVGFAIAGEDQKFHGATARIVEGSVIVSSKNVSAPAAVRYGWAAKPRCNLVNTAALPASPFRTDSWK